MRKLNDIKEAWAKPTINAKQVLTVTAVVGLTAAAFGANKGFKAGYLKGADDMAAALMLKLANR